MKHTSYIEQFHLLFLDQLGRKIDKQLYVLKGGCNLRFFLKSIRYSQDIDLDVQIIRKETLSNQVNKILSSHPFHIALKQLGIEIKTVTSAKQTDTTQRWKLTLISKEVSLPIHTKIEFSRREFASGILFGPVDPIIIQQYQLPPILVNHYVAKSALEQKIAALAGRSQTQARDIFDFYHLLNIGTSVDTHPTDIKAKARSAAYTVTYQDFLSQVVSYLPSDYQSLYSDHQLWDAMVLSVTEALQ